MYLDRRRTAQDARWIHRASSTFPSQTIFLLFFQYFVYIRLNDLGPFANIQRSHARAYNTRICEHLTREATKREEGLSPPPPHHGQKRGSCFIQSSSLLTDIGPDPNNWPTPQHKSRGHISANWINLLSHSNFPRRHLPCKPWNTSLQLFALYLPALPKGS
jgi:hypothetical protein